MPTPGLLRIPTELQHMIANLTGKKDILALRLVCRDLSRAVDDTFLETFYSKRRHLITPYSLEYFVTISKDARLRSRLREVEFVIAEVAWHMDPARDDITILFGRDKEFEEPSLEEQMANEREDAEKRANWQQWLEFSAVVRSPITEDLLSAALANLKAVSIVPDLEIGCGTKYPSVAFGYAQLVTSLKIAQTSRAQEPHFSIFKEDFEDDMTKAAPTAVNTLLRAIAKTKYPAKRLTLGSSHTIPQSFEPLGSNTPILLDGPVLTGLRASLYQLTAISLGVGNALNETTTSEFQGFAELFACATALTDVTLYFDIKAAFWEYVTNPALGEMFKHLKLQKMTISEGLFTLAGLQALLQPNQHSLKILRIDNVALGSEHDWRQLFSWLVQSFKLKGVDIEGAGVDGWLTIEHSIHGDGEQEVNSELQVAAAEATFVQLF